MADTCFDSFDDRYTRARRIQNARFYNLFPALICPCKTPADVAAAIRRAVNATPRLPIRVRAGGHHHEGMCSGNGVLMLDVSPMTNIDVDTRSGIVTVGPGAKNGDIYNALWDLPGGQHRVFCGGGCGDVRVGGFINFPDRDIPIGEYYDQNFDRLKRHKRDFDPDGYFDFEMGIPRG